VIKAACFLLLQTTVLHPGVAVAVTYTKVYIPPHLDCQVEAIKIQGAATWNKFIRDAEGNITETFLMSLGRVTLIPLPDR
jgi:hypothetical protein